jgi:hypothetical protein
MWDQSAFDAAMQQYIAVSKRTIAEIVNTKAYYIARKANWFTSKADANAIKSGLAYVVMTSRTTKKGKIVKMQKIGKLKPGRSGAPLAALIIQKREAAAGRKSPFFGKTRSAGKAAMRRMVMQMIAARARSAAFLKAGWLPAIWKLEPFADRGQKPPIDRDAKQVGQPKGSAEPAREGFNPVAQIMNSATTLRDNKRALEKYGAGPLQRAFDDEARSMMEYVEMKMRKDADQFNRANSVRGRLSA